MDYKKLYTRIINRRKQYPFSGYIEKHHVIPRSLGGSDALNNLVNLNAREHFICHYLLTKIYKKYSFEWYKTTHAFLMMKCASIRHDRYINSRLYENAKCYFSVIMSTIQTGSNNSQFNKMWICNINLRKNKKILKMQAIPEGWIRGRSKWNCLCATCGDVINSKDAKYCDICRPLLTPTSRVAAGKKLEKYSKEKFLELYKEHTETGTSLQKLASKYGFNKYSVYDYKRKYADQ